MAKPMIRHTGWPHQNRMYGEVQAFLETDVRSVVVQSATGTGKSLVQQWLLEYAASNHKKAILYTHRRVLFEQLKRGLYDRGITHGIRASGYRQHLSRPIQLAMAQSEVSAVLKSQYRELHDADLVIVDEAHQQAKGRYYDLLQKHLSLGNRLIGFTATPADLGDLYARLISGAGPTEGRHCGALVKAHCYAPDMPSEKLLKADVFDSDFKDTTKREKWCKTIIGRVLDYYDQLNPHRLPTILFAPGRPESKWFAEQFTAHGVPAAHIDCNETWFDGVSQRGFQFREQILEGLSTGRVKVLCNRFIAREGFDCPSIYHCILATKFSGPSPYLQAVGRALRAHPSLTHVVIQDHAGNCYRFGSPNEERFWRLGDSDKGLTYERRSKLERDKIDEPYRCPACSAVLAKKGKCPLCGHEFFLRSRAVIQLDGSLRMLTNKMFRLPDPPSGDALDLWIRIYFGHSKKGYTFAQAFNSFAYKHAIDFHRRALPDPSWPLYPKYARDHIRRIRDVPRSRLNPQNTEAITHG